MRNRNWTEEEFKILEENYPVRTPQEVADMIGRTKASVVRMACIRKVEGSRYFTQEERDYIEKSVGKMSYSYIAKKLGRTYDSIKKYTNKNYCNNYNNANHLTGAEVGRILGLNRSAIYKNWSGEGKLKLKKVGRNVFISEKELIDYLKANPNRWDATKVDKSFFSKYKWFEEKHKADFDKMIKKRWGNEAR